MRIELTSKKTIKEIQAEFSQMFPYLKLEFFSKPHTIGKGTKKEYMNDSSLSLGESSGNEEVFGMVDITEDTVVHDLEKMLREHFGLNVQVFRKSGKIWLETTATDNWTLGYQNSQGKELDNANLSNDMEESDFREQA